MSTMSVPGPPFAEKLELVAQTALLLLRTPHLETIAQRATDSGLQVTGAQFGSLLLNDASLDSRRIVYTVAWVSGSRASTFPAATEQAAQSALKERAVIRSRDITRDSRFRGPLPGDGLPHEERSVRSYLAVPLRNIAGEALGAFVFGHEEPDVFDDSAEALVKLLAAHSAAALEALSLREQLSHRISEVGRVQQQGSSAAKRLGELAAIVESSDDAIISKDLSGTINSWNAAAARILGYQPDEIIGRSILTLIPEELHSDEPRIIAQIRAGQRVEHFETVRRKKSGELIDVSLTISPIKDERGQIVGASKILRDISARKRIETSLLQAEKLAATGRMAATIAHEINNPLEAVLNLMFLLRPLVSTTEGKTYLSTAEIELNRVAHIAKQTLGYYRENTSAISIEVVSLVEHALIVYSPRCAAFNIAIERSLESRAALVVRRGEMVQVISNLFANSIYAMPNGGTLSATVREVTTPEPGVLLIIEDTGVGIPEENLSRVFDAFFTTRQTIGTGIGLFVARQFVEGHGGRMWIESSTDSESHGTRVSVLLPLHTTYELDQAISSERVN